ncbi:MAG: hypothetical protein WCG79_09045 [Verrucomicrobiota bacterium]
MNAFLPVVVALLMAGSALAQQNLISNGDFSDTDPLKGWRIAFPYQGQYSNNAAYCRVTTQLGRKCIEISPPPDVISSQGAKVETMLVPAVVGASYRAEVDCLGWDFSVKAFAEAYMTAPCPEGSATHSLAVIPGTNGGPCKIWCYRSDYTDPHANGKKWTTSVLDFTLLPKGKVYGKECKPEWVTIKVVVWSGTSITGKSFFTNFRLYRTK